MEICFRNAFQNDDNRQRRDHGSGQIQVTMPILMLTFSLLLGQISNMFSVRT